jgi:hypothetical protein
MAGSPALVRSRRRPSLTRLTRWLPGEIGTVAEPALAAELGAKTTGPELLTGVMLRT